MATVRRAAISDTRGTTRSRYLFWYLFDWSLDMLTLLSPSPMALVM
jgi:hypothetical protein